MAKLKKLWLHCRHLLPVLLYLIFYLGVFSFIEKRISHHLHFLVTSWDRMIPFCEYFIVPYILWFFYVAFTVLYFAFVEKDRRQYWMLVINLGTGMTVFLIVSLIFPNAQTLRPMYVDHSNIFVDMVRSLWRTDTPTNILPSIHVFNSVAVHIAISHNAALRKHPRLIRASLALCILIILSTMFLKQHTIIDVLAALFLNLACYHLLYQPASEHGRPPEEASERFE